MPSCRFVPLLILSNIYSVSIVLSRDTYCTLVILSPRWSSAIYLDSRSLLDEKIDYAKVQGFLDEALEGYAKKGGAFEKKHEFIKNDGNHQFQHAIEHSCIKQKSGGVKDAFYTLHHLKMFVQDAPKTKLPSSLKAWIKCAGEITNSELREDFYRIQVQLSRVIVEDVQNRDGCLHPGRGSNKSFIFFILTCPLR